jgi:hypothetical protein
MKLDKETRAGGKKSVGWGVLRLFQEAANVLLLWFGIVYCAADHIGPLNRVGAQDRYPVEGVLVPLEVLDHRVLQQNTKGTLQRQNPKP